MTTSLEEVDFDCITSVSLVHLNKSLKTRSSSIESQPKKFVVVVVIFLDDIVFVVVGLVFVVVGLVFVVIVGHRNLTLNLVKIGSLISHILLLLLLLSLFNFFVADPET